MTTEVRADWYLVWFLFKLDDYSPENSELKGIKVLVNPVDGEEKTYIFSYPLTGEDVPGFNPLDLAELK